MGIELKDNWERIPSNPTTKIEKKNETPNINLDKVNEKILNLRNTCYSKIGIKGNKMPGYDKSSNSSQNFLKGIVDSIVEPLGVLIALNKLDINSIYNNISKFNIGEFVTEFLKDFTNFPKNAWELGKQASAIVMKLSGYLTILNSSVSIIKQIGKINGNEKIITYADTTKILTSGGTSVLKDYVKNKIRNSKKFDKFNKLTKNIDEKLRSLNQNTPEYAKIAAHLSIITTQVNLLVSNADNQKDSNKANLEIEKAINLMKTVDNLVPTRKYNLSR